MPTRMDPLAQQAEVGGRTYRLRLDCRAEAALVTVGEREYRVRLLQWREKAMLSRFTSLGETLVMRELVHLCTDTTEDLPQETATVLSEVAAWINDPSRAGAAVPFDRRSVATVMLQLCRAMQLRPGDFDGRPAVEVEEMWQALNSENAQVAAPPEAASSSANRIVILPDPEETTHHDTPSPGRAETAPPPSAASPTEAPQTKPLSAPFRLLQPTRVGMQRDTPHTVNNETPAGQANLTAGVAPHPGPLPAEWGEGTEAGTRPEAITGLAQRDADPNTASTVSAPHTVNNLFSEPATNPVPSPRYSGERASVRGGSRAALDQVQPANTATHHAADSDSMVSGIAHASPAVAAFVRHERPIAAHLVANQQRHPEREPETGVDLASNQPAGVASFRSEPMHVLDNESLFDELADRLAEAAADMGIGEV